MALYEGVLHKVSGGEKISTERRAARRSTGRGSAGRGTRTQAGAARVHRHRRAPRDRRDAHSVPRRDPDGGGRAAGRVQHVRRRRLAHLLRPRCVEDPCRFVVTTESTNVYAADVSEGLGVRHVRNRRQPSSGSRRSDGRAQPSPERNIRSRIATPSRCFSRSGGSRADAHRWTSTARQIQPSRSAIASADRSSEPVA